MLLACTQTWLLQLPPRRHIPTYMLVLWAYSLSRANNVGTQKGFGVKLPTPVARDLRATGFLLSRFFWPKKRSELGQGRIFSNNALAPPRVPQNVFSFDFVTVFECFVTSYVVKPVQLAIKKDIGHDNGEWGSRTGNGVALNRKQPKMTENSTKSPN